jgi:hypothetical protein
MVVVTTGIRETDIAAQILLYPNPVSDMLFAESALFAGSEVSVAISDVTGQVVPLLSTHRGSHINIDCGSLAGGVYWAKFTVNGRSVSKRFVKAG